MINKVWAYMKEHQMAREGSHICAGISGGADSVCLLLVLARLRDRMGFTLSAVHVEHGIRGGESLQDMEFAGTLAARHGISFAAYDCPVPELAKAKGCSLEEAGRNARYEIFAKEAARHGAHARIALAHHANDNAETVLFHLCRGSGIDGLSGIRPVRGNIIRPLLGITRAEIEAFLAKEGQAYRTDATNADIAYSRNRIRSRILPELLCINAQALRHMNRLAQEAGLLSDYLCAETEEILRQRLTREDGGRLCFSLAGFEKYPVILQGRVMLSLLAEASGSRKDLAREHVDALLDLAAAGAGKRLCLPYGIAAEKGYGMLFLSAGESKKEEAKPTGHLSCRIFEFSKKDGKIEQNVYTKWFDYDKIKNRLRLRTRQPGDYFTIDGQGHKQKLADYWINEKVPRAKREHILLLAEDSHILWAIGYRISAYYKITEQTKRVLEVQYMEEKGG